MLWDCGWLKVSNLPPSNSRQHAAVSISISLNHGLPPSVASFPPIRNLLYLSNFTCGMTFNSFKKAILRPFLCSFLNLLWNSLCYGTSLVNSYFYSLLKQRSENRGLVEFELVEIPRYLNRNQNIHRRHNFFLVGKINTVAGKGSCYHEW